MASALACSSRLAWMVSSVASMMTVEPPACGHATTRMMPPGVLRKPWLRAFRGLVGFERNKEIAPGRCLARWCIGNLTLRGVVGDHDQVRAAKRGSDGVRRAGVKFAAGVDRDAFDRGDQPGGANRGIDQPLRLEAAFAGIDLDTIERRDLCVRGGSDRGVGKLEPALERIAHDRGRQRCRVAAGFDKADGVGRILPLEQDAEIERGRVHSDANDFHSDAFRLASGLLPSRRNRR